MSSVIVVDDEERVLSLLTRCLVGEGHSVDTARDGEEAMERLAEESYDLMLLDLVMPRLNGLQVLGRLRADSHSGSAPPVIVLSAVNEVAARVEALDRGAVDFVPKPFHTAELLARIRRSLVPAVVPSQRRPESGRYLEGGGLRLDLNRRRADSRGHSVPLSEREFGLLAHLMRRSGDVCRREELLHDIWGLDFDPGSNVVEVCVRRLRAKIEDAPIETVRGVGYCFAEDRG